MSEQPTFLSMANGASVPRSKLPRLPLDDFRKSVVGATKRGRRVAALFGHLTGEGGVGLVAVLAADADGLLDVTTTELTSNAFPSMTPDCPEVHLFEREIAENWGVTPEGHPWLKPVRFSPPMREPTNGAAAKAGGPTTIGVTDFYKIEGEEAHEVAVGPVHAGVIEPGHFRFQCHGEQVFHLEISLGYQHRGLERALVGGPNKRTIHYVETLAGDTTVGHATAYCQVVEGLSGTHAPARALALRAIGLELERLANHTGGLAALANDVGFLPTASFCGRLRGDYLNLSAVLCGSRFGRGLVRPGGAGFDADANRLKEMSTKIELAFRDTDQAVKLLWDTPSVMARFEETGRVETGVARQLGLVGVAARACGLKRDVRKTHPSGYYRFAHIPISTWMSGDVFSRAYVRWLEIERSVDFLRGQFRRLPEGPMRVSPGPLRPDHLAVSLVEGWRGEICHVAMTDEVGRFAAYKVVDPSFHNWTALAMALREQQISDFPLCNKSFDLSYCGHDL
jgi:Ni,Fe-hydrogenase III large subunit